MILFGTQVMHLDDRWVGILTTFAAIGIGIGSMVAGRLSGDKVELGLTPIGAIGMGIFGILLSQAGHSFALAAVHLTMVGFFGGLFAVPLNAMLQQRSGDEEKGRLMATNNFLNTVAILLASGVLALTHSLQLTPDRVVLIFGVITLLSSLYVLSVVPEFLVRFSLWLLTHTVYRIRIVGAEHVPSRGPALLVCNHVSHIDGFLVGACVQRSFASWSIDRFTSTGRLHRLLRMMHAIPIASGSREAVAALEKARAELAAGHVVCVFAEGAITRTGNLLPFKRGFERIASGLDVPIVPVYLDRVWGSIFSFKGGKFFWKWPARFPYPVTVAFGPPLPSSATTAAARLAILASAADVAASRRPSHESLGREFVKAAKRHWSALAMADSTGQRLSFGRSLTAALLLSRWLRRQAGDQPMIGLLLPASVGGALANIAATLAGKAPVNLNFTAGHDAMMAAVEQCRLKTILTSRAFLSKAGIETLDGMVFVEDILKRISSASRLAMLIAAFTLPARLLSALFVRQTAADALATVIFSSGSTGIPKGVMLSHRNILANVDSVGQLFRLADGDVMIGILPFFHSFGFTGTIWFPLLTGFAVVYHPNPMDAKTIGDLSEQFGGSLLISTPTFCSSYIRKCRPEQFAKLRYAIVGAERLREPIAAAFREKFGVDLLEGYGCTEMAPIVAVNVPDVDDAGDHQRGARPGTVGHPLPGVAAKIVHP
jgi:acyl-[acyl-carrier-protein]-phospholipid O-acyltransferase/long-chain-fatty-acid--[acyl-carrier-protein] ligase